MLQYASEFCICLWSTSVSSPVICRFMYLSYWHTQWMTSHRDLVQLPPPKMGIVRPNLKGIKKTRDIFFWGQFRDATWGCILIVATHNVLSTDHMATAAPDVKTSGETSLDGFLSLTPLHKCQQITRLVSYVCGWRGFFQVFQVITEGGGEKRRTVFRLTVDLNSEFEATRVNRSRDLEARHKQIKLPSRRLILISSDHVLSR